MTWQKKARFAIAVFVVVFITIVAVALRSRKAVPQAGAIPERKDPKALVENTQGGEVAIQKEGRVVLRIKFGSQFSYPDGRSKFTNGVEVMSDRNGRSFTVTSREAELVQNGADLKTAHFTGAVKLMSEGLEVSGEEATYDEAEGVVKVPGAVAFRRGRMTGTGVGATYDRNREVLWLLDKAQVNVAADEKGQGALEATAAAAGLAQLDHYARLTGRGHINAEGRLIDADEIVIQLTEDNERVKKLELRGNSSISGGAGATQSMSARDADLTYADDGRTLQHVNLIENSVVQLPGSGGSTGSRVAGKTIEMAMGPDGSTLTNLNANENVQVDLPADGERPAKRIRSATLAAKGAPGAGLQNAVFGGNVEYRETRAARQNVAAGERVARSLTLTVETKPGFGAVEQADFHGNVHFTDGPQVAADAQRALYHVETDQIDLSSSGDPGPVTPRVSDGRVTVEARTIEFVLGTRKLKADTKVRSSMLPSAKKGTAATTSAKPTTAAAPQGTEQGRLPSLLKQDEAVTITSDKLDYDGLTGRAVYTGSARLWQGDTTVRGDAITVDDKTGNLEATGNAQTDMTLDQVDEKTGVRTPTRTKGDAGSFVYDDTKRLATYTIKAHMVGSAGDVTADKLELFLKPAANELERAEGYGENGAVIVKEMDERAPGAPAERR
jgi:lipopolysaccharide export system protein LptA